MNSNYNTMVLFQKMSRCFPLNTGYVRGVASSYNMDNFRVVKRVCLFTKDSIRMVHNDGREDTVLECKGYVDEMWTRVLGRLEESHEIYLQTTERGLAHPMDAGFTVEYHVMVPDELVMASLVCNEQPCDCVDPMQLMSDADMMQMVNL